MSVLAMKREIRKLSQYLFLSGNWYRGLERCPLIREREDVRKWSKKKGELMKDQRAVTEEIAWTEPIVCQRCAK